MLPRLLIALVGTLALATQVLAEPPKGLPHADLGASGLDAAKLAQIGPKLAGFVERGEISGAVTLVAHQGKTVHLEAVGMADLEGQRPMRPDTLFAVASMTKPITATAVMILHDEGKLQLDDPVEKYIPAFANVKLKDGSAPKTKMTLKHCLTHTAGLQGEQRTLETLEKTCEDIAQRPLLFEPGEKWSYSPGLSVAGRIVEIVSGKPFDQFLAERVFEPLHMLDTSFNPTSEQRERAALLYQAGKEKKLVSLDHWIRNDAGVRAPNPSGGLRSTAPDISRFYQMILNGGELDGQRIVSKKAVETLTTCQTGDLQTGFTPGNCWGLGFCLIREPQGVTRMLSPGSFGHGGAYGTQSWADPKRQMIVILMIQRQGLPNSDASAMRETLQELAVAAMEK